MDAGTPDEKAITYSYNALGQQASCTDYFGGIADSVYNSRGWLTSKAGAGYEYNANGTVASASFGDNTQAYTYDNRLQTVTNTIKNSFQTTLYSESNTFNNAGNMTESVTAFYDTQSNTKTLAHTYGYDIFGQLTGEQYKQSGITLYENAFDYDYSGNLTELNNETFGVNEKNQLEATVDDSENTTLAYDDNGNLLSRTYLDEEEQIIHTETYVYDVWGHMVESYVGGLTTEYTYYPDGLRKTKTVNEETTQYYYDGDVVVNEAVNGQWSASNVKALGNRIVKRTTEDGENALMYNSRGDVVMILAWENSAEPVAAYLYLAYGKLYSDLSDFYGASTLYDPYVFDCPILYAGQYYDHETGLYYLRARYYSPDLCRFISEDPIKDGLNWYAYCAGNPVMRVDPTGQSMIVTALLKAAAGGAIDLLVQLTINYFFNPDTQYNLEASFEAVNWIQVGRSALEAAIPWKIPGGKWGKAAFTAAGDVIVNALTYGEDYSLEQALMDFAGGFFSSIAADTLIEILNGYNFKGDTVREPNISDKGINNNQPKPPGWDDEWEWRYPEGESNANQRWFDPSGGEWRWHEPDKWHSEGHWDYNPWTEWNSPWQNIYP